jgi:hypothetical protein
MIIKRWPFRVQPFAPQVTKSGWSTNRLPNCCILQLLGELVILKWSSGVPSSTAQSLSRSVINK